ncbi:DUF6634 family protein [Microvirga flavescens]|uniref:DUF6634 family protein n=1 Tax=Microvirga flavescens TaxID=2249811 RepID=UPI0018E0A598|nr:DUF6634 family protein [Microvirga flavescens]
MSVSLLFQQPFGPWQVLEGFGVDHLRLGTQPIITSGLFAIDAARGWARTYSRFYRLALPSRTEGGVS